MKTCTKCNKHLKNAEFNRCRATPTGLQSYCRSCSRAAARRWWKKHGAEALARKAQQQDRPKQETFKLEQDRLPRHRTAPARTAPVHYHMRRNFFVRLWHRIWRSGT